MKFIKIILPILIVLACLFQFKQITKPKQNNILDVPLIAQYPLLPTGCESVAATMVLQYYDENVTAVEFASNYLASSQDFYYVNQTLYGPDPDVVFAGNPFTKNSYGCYANVITNAINKHSSKCRAKTLKNVSLEKICERYIDSSQPILIWATMHMKASERGNQWKLENGENFTWIAGEHCLVLVGYDASNYYFNDPLTGTCETYSKEITEQRYQELGCQAVYIYPKENRLP